MSHASRAAKDYPPRPYAAAAAAAKVTDFKLYSGTERVVVIRRTRPSKSCWLSMGTNVNGIAILLSICVLQVLVEAGYTPSSCSTDSCCTVRNMSNTKHKTELYCLGIENIPAVDDAIHVLTLEDSDIKEFSENTINLYKNSLKDIIFINAKNLNFFDPSTFKNLNGLQSLYISRAKALKEIPSDLFRGLSKSFLALRIMKTNLRTIPDLSDLGNSTAMHTIEFEGNHVDTLPTNGIKTRAEQLLLEYNKIRVVENWAFNGSEIARLSLKGNHLDHLSEHSFDGIINLLTLDLSESSMTILPTLGLSNIEILRVEDTPTLTVIPPIYLFSNLREAHLTYSFHCCSFRSQNNGFRPDYQLQQEALQGTTTACNQMKNNNMASQDFDENKFAVYNGSEDEQFYNEPAAITGTQQILCGNITPAVRITSVMCTPQPNALNPCEDVMSAIWLRISVWVVGTTSFLSNFVAMLIVVRQPLNNSAPRFLMFNLAFADFCTANYLLLLAYQDTVSSNEYFNHAYKWQNGIGCKVGGFLIVFSSQLSVFSLGLLTIERWYSIRRAMYTNKMTFPSTVRKMAFGWAYSLMMATMPLMGVSSYSTTSICLPMDIHRRPGGMFYMSFLLMFGGASFLLMLFCYLQIYLSLSYETRHAAKGEASVARKIFVLVGTNFVCTVPVIFFGLTALLGYPLVNLTDSKILLVFFYPINSCANPFLYTILTTNFRREAFSTISKYGLCGDKEKQYKVVYSTQAKDAQPQLSPAHGQTLALTIVQQPQQPQQPEEEKKTPA